MDLSWPHPPAFSVNRCTQNDTYLGVARKMHLLLGQDFINLIRQEGCGSLLYCYDMARMYRKLPLDLPIWQLVCIKVEGRYFTDISLPFSLFSLL